MPKRRKEELKEETPRSRFGEETSRKQEKKKKEPQKPKVVVDEAKQI